MEVGHEAVLGRVHAHRCNHHSVGDLQVLDLKGLEQERDLVCSWQLDIDGSEVGARSNLLFDTELFFSITMERLLLVGRHGRGFCVGKVFVVRGRKGDRSGTIVVEGSEDGWRKGRATKIQRDGFECTEWAKEHVGTGEKRGK